MESAQSTTASAVPSASRRWIEFWNGPHSIYVNRRNLEAHFACIGRDAAVHLPADGTVLDYGCGDALAAEAMAEGCRSLLLYDAAPAVRERLTQRFAGHPKIRVLDDAAFAALPRGSIDLVLVVSVLQYVPEGELLPLLSLWRSLIAPTGRLIVADVVDPGTPMLSDIASQLDFAWKNGFLIAALAGLVRMAVSDYRRLRREAGFSTYTPDEVIEALGEVGLAGERLARNIGPTPHRRSFVARPTVA